MYYCNGFIDYRGGIFTDANRDWLAAFSSSCDWIWSMDSIPFERIERKRERRKKGKNNEHSLLWIIDPYDLVATCYQEAENKDAEIHLIQMIGLRGRCARFIFFFFFFTLTVDVIELIIRINNKLVYRFQLELDWDFVLFHFWFIWSIFNLHQILLHTNVWHLFNEISFIWLIQNGKSQQTNPLLKPTKMDMNGQNRFLIKKAFIQVQSTQQAY